MTALWLASLLGCTSVETAVDFDEVRLDRQAGQFLVDDAPFTGRATRWLAEGIPAEEAWFQGGRRHGWRRHYHPNGQIADETFYVRGRREGPTRSWWSNGRLRTDGQLRNDRPHGVQRQWYASGALFKETHLVEGVEVGMQRAWRSNGKIYNNYEARDGRIYGLRRSKMCFELTEEDITLVDQLSHPGPVGL